MSTGSTFLDGLVEVAITGIAIYAGTIGLLYALNWLAGVFLRWEDCKLAKKDFLKRLSGD